MLGRAERFARLQSDIGNRAVTRLIQRSGPAPTPYEPGTPLQGMELGATRVTGGEMPRFRVSTESGGAGIRATVDPTTTGSVEISARYVGPGVYDIAPAVDGTPRKLLVPADVVSTVQAGEQEHSDDYWWAHQLIAGEAARAVNVLSTQPAKDAPTLVEVHAQWRAALHDTVSPKLRIGNAESDPRSGGTVTEPWSRARSALHQSSLNRDSSGWHTMRMRTATAAEQRTNPVPAGTTLMVAVTGGQIGQHPAEARMRAAYAALPDRP